MTGSVRVERVRIPFRTPFATAASTFEARDSWLVRLTAADGRIGWGEAVAETPEAAAVLAALLEDLEVTGLAPAQPLLDRAGAGGRAFRAAFDGASLDLQGQSGEGPPAGRATVTVNAVIPAAHPAEAEAAASAAVAAGFGTIKLKAAPDASTAGLVELVGAVRAAVGDEVSLRLDVNGTWDPESAAQRLRALAGFALQYVEQPLAPHELEAAARLRSQVGTPIAADESAQSIDAVRAILDVGAADVLVIKPSRVGGPDAVREIAGLAAERGVPVVVSTLFESGVGIALALACAGGVPEVSGWPAGDRAHGLATADLLQDDLIRARLVLAHGCLSAPFGPGSGGLGVTVDEAAVRRYAADREP